MSIKQKSKNLPYERTQGRRSNRFGGWLRKITEQYPQIRYVDIDGIMRNDDYAFAFEIKEIDEYQFDEIERKYWYKKATKEQQIFLWELSQKFKIPAYLIWMKDIESWTPPIEYNNPYECKECGTLLPQPALAAINPVFRVFKIVGHNSDDLEHIGIFDSYEFVSFILRHNFAMKKLKRGPYDC